MRFLPALRRTQDVDEFDRDNQIDYTLDEWMSYLNELVYNGNTYFTQSPPQTQPGQRQEPIGPAYRSLTDLAYKTDSVVFSCMLTRAQHFSEVRFQFRQMNNGRPGKLFGTQDLQPLEEPWAGGTTGDLLTRMIMHADLGGNAFVVRRGDGVALLRPDWVTIIIGSNTDPNLGAWATDSDILGYIYSPGGYATDGYETETYTADQVAHFAPIPDPEARFRGMSWLTPLIREVMADKAASEHKLKFFENPTPNMVVKMDVPNLDEFKAQVQAFKDAHMGPKNAYKYMFTASGVDATVVGSNMKDLDYKLITGAGETRIAAAARTPPVIVGLSEGLQGSALNSGNYQAARRMFADGCIRPLWRNASGSLANIINVPGGAELWTDDRDVAFLKEDLQERAAVMQTHAQAVRYLVDAGYKPDTVIDAIVAEDLSLLEHSGLFSVQLQAANAPKQGLFAGIPEPNTQPGAPPTSETTPATNGNGNGNGNGAPPRALELGDTHVHFDEGSFRFELPPAPDVHIHEGAIQNEITSPDVNVSPAEVRFEEGSINVQPAEVTFEEGAIRNEITTPDVHVDAPVTIEEGAVRVAAPPPANITVEPTRIEEGAVQVNVEPPEVEVTVERSGKRRVDYGNGRSAVITDGDAKRIDFDDGESVTVTELPEDDE
jgi:phage portal protein BeeE